MKQGSCPIGFHIDTGICPKTTLLKVAYIEGLAFIQQRDLFWPVRQKSSACLKILIYNLGKSEFRKF